MTSLISIWKMTAVYSNEFYYKSIPCRSDGFPTFALQRLDDTSRPILKPF